MYNIFLKTFHIAYTFIETHLRSIWDIYEAREQFFTLQNKKKHFVFYIYEKMIFPLGKKINKHREKETFFSTIILCYSYALFSIA